MQAHGGQSIVALDDCFVIKYNASGPGGQRALEKHVDGGDLSFMVALSDRARYTGGGTAFYGPGNVVDSIVELEQGQCVSFPAKVMHQGLAITAGIRYEYLQSLYPTGV